MKRENCLARRAAQRPLPFTDVRPLLSPTQEKILSAFETGQRHKETADALGISLNTLKTHVRLILAKTGARTCIEAAYRRRQVKPA